MEAFQIAAYEHHVVIGIPYADGALFEWWLTPQDADALAWAIGNTLSQLDSEREGRMYAGRDLFTEYGEALAQSRTVRSVAIEEAQS